MGSQLRRCVAAMAVAVAATSAVASACGSPADRVPARTQVPTVTDVVDGDTVVVRIGHTDEHVRLIGVDTPETKHPSKPVECFGAEAATFTAAVLPPGTEVRLVGDTEERDAFGRLLAYVWRAHDGVFVNLELAAQGYADLLTIAPNVAHTRELADAVAAARTTGRGLWGACGGPGVPADRGR